MGADINSSSNKLDGSVNKTAGGSAGGPASGYSGAKGTTAPATATAGADTAGSAESAGGTAKEEKKIPGLSSVENEVPAPPKPQKKAARKSTGKKKKKEPEVSYNAAQLQSLILSGSAIIASRENMSMFALSPEEAQQLASPIANMIDKSEKLASLGEYADAISLVTAAMLIFIPRFIIYSDVKKKEKIRKNGGVKIVTEKRKTDAGNGRDAGKPAEQPHNGSQNIGSILPAYDGF